MYSLVVSPVECKLHKGRFCPLLCSQYLGNLCVFENVCVFFVILIFLILLRMHENAILNQLLEKSTAL